MTYAHIFERDPHLKSQNDYNPKLWLVQRLYRTTVFFENNENTLYIDLKLLKLKAKQNPSFTSGFHYTCAPAGGAWANPAFSLTRKAECPGSPVPLYV